MTTVPRPTRPASIHIMDAQYIVDLEKYADAMETEDKAWQQMVNQLLSVKDAGNTEELVRYLRTEREEARVELTNQQDLLGLLIVLAGGVPR